MHDRTARFICSCAARPPIWRWLNATTPFRRSLSPRMAWLFARSGGLVIWLFSKCLVEDAVVRHHGEPNHNGNKRYLRADAQNDILFDLLVGMNPAMKSLKGPQRFMREVGVNSVEGIGQHGSEGAE